MQTFRPKLLKLYTYALILALLPAAAQAQDDGAAMDILPTRSYTDDMVTVTNNDATHPAVKLTPDRSELVRLDREAATVVVGNPAHLSVLIDTSQTLVLVPKMPGATHFTALDNKGNVIMQRHVIVASPKQHYVRVRRSCAGGGDNCQQTSVFYCPDMCHQVNVVSDASSSGGSQSSSADALANAATNGNGGGSEEGGEGGGSETAE